MVRAQVWGALLAALAGCPGSGPGQLPGSLPRRDTPPSPPAQVFVALTPSPPAPLAAVYLSNSRLSSAAYRDRYTSKAYSLSLNAMAWSQPESQELSRRRLSLLFYLIRSPAFESATRSGSQRA